MIRLQQSLPPGWSQAEWDWLTALAQAPDSATRTRLLNQHPERLTAAFVESRVQVVADESPAVAQQLLIPVQGLTIVADSLRQPHLQGLTRLAQALLLGSLYRYEEAERTLTEAEGFLKRANATRELGQLAFLRASFAFDRGDFSRTRQNLERAYALLQKVGDTQSLTRCDYLWALYYRAIGAPEKGMPYLQRALERARKTRDSNAEAKIWMVMGILHRGMEQYDDALYAYEQAMRHETHPLERARLIANIGLVYWSMGLYSEARAHYAQAMPIFREAQSLRDVATCLMNSGLLLEAEGDIQGALEAYDEALRISQQIGDEYGVAFCELNRASALIGSKRDAQALEAARRASAILARLGARMELTICRINQVSALIQLGRYAEGETVARQTLQQGEISPLYAVQLRYLLGENQRHQKRFADAERNYAQCLTLLARLQSFQEIPAEERGLYLAKLREVVAGIGVFWAQRKQFSRVFAVCQQGKGTTLRLLRPAKTASALPLSEQARLDRLQQRWEQAQNQMQNARTTAERRRHQRAYTQAYAEWSRLRQQLSRRYPRWQLQQSAPLTAGQIPLESSTAIAEYLMGEDAIAIVCLTAQKGRRMMEGALTPLPRERLEQTVRLLLDALERGESLSALLPHARNLYNWLIRPIEPLLQGRTRWVLCGDGILHSVPWSALVDAQGRYLIERAALCGAPSASVWSQLMRTSRRPLERPLMVALSEFEGARVDARTKLGPLPGTRREQQVVRRHLRSLNLLTESQATRERVLQALPSASLIHIATHALPNNNAPMQSAFALHRGWLYAQDVVARPLKADLAILSACSTAQGKVTMDGLMGLGWAFLFAGCRSVAATLWKLPDEGIEVWMDAFYARYRGGASTAQAVQTACQRMLKHPRYAHPRYWGAWSVMGAG